MGRILPLRSLCLTLGWTLLLVSGCERKPAMSGPTRLFTDWLDGESARSSRAKSCTFLCAEFVCRPPRLSRRFTTLDSSAEIAARRNIQPEELSHMLRGELDWIVTRSLEKDRKKRYQSVSEFADDIQRHLSGEAVAACPPTLRYHMGKFVRRYKMPVYQEP